MLRNNGRHNFRSPYFPQPSLVLDFAGTTTLDPRVTFTRSTTGTYYNSSGVLTTAAIDAPRFDYNPSTLAPLGLLIEQSSTNLLTYSEQFNNAVWGKFNTTVTANSTTAPDGTTTADSLTENTANSFHTMDGSFVAGAGNFTSSIYIKPNGRNFVRIYVTQNFPSADFTALFNLTTGTLVSADSGVTALIQYANNGWYRCSVSATTSGTLTRLTVGLQNATGPIAPYTGDGTSGIYIWGAQLEALAFSTSYISTTSAQVTRASDNASMTGTNFSSWYNQGQGTLYEEITLNSNVAFPRMPNFYNSASPNTNNIDIWYGSGANLASAGTRVNGTSYPTSNIYVAFTPPATGKFGFSFASGQGYFSVNGSSPTSISALTIPTVDTFAIASSTNTYFYAGGSIYIKKISYYPQAVTSTQLQALTGS